MICPVSTETFTLAEFGVWATSTSASFDVRARVGYQGAARELHPMDCRVDRWLSFPRVIALGVAAKTLLWLPWPFLTRGRGAFDEHWLEAALSGQPSLGAMTPSRLFQFADGRPEHLGVARGPVPWFADPELRLAFFRPLSELTHRLDHATFGVTSTFAYVHSFVWSVALLLVVARWFQRLLEPRLAGLSVLVFSVAGASIEPTNWIAARNASIAATLGVAALVAHAEWRIRAAPCSRVAAVALFGLSLLAGEAALGVLGFLVAEEALVEAPLSARARSLAPFLAVSVLWLGLHAALGFGTHASGLYTSPLSEPGAFLSEAPARFLVLASGALMGAPPAFWFFHPEYRPAMVLLGVFGIAVTAFAAAPAWRVSSPAERRRMSSLALGAFLALLPQLGGALGSRSLLVPSFGIAPLVAWCLLGAPSAPSVPARMTAAPRAVLLLVHFVVTPLSWWALEAGYGAALGNEEAALARHDPADFRGKHVLILECPDPKFAFYLPMKLASDRGLSVLSWNVLSAAYAEHRVTRTGPATLEVVARNERLLEAPFELLFRSPRRPLHAGDRVALGFAEAEVLEWRRGVHSRVRFTFATGLDDPSLSFAAWRDGALRPVPLPALGESVDLPFEKGPWML